MDNYEHDFIECHALQFHFVLPLSSWKRHCWRFLLVLCPSYLAYQDSISDEWRGYSLNRRWCASLNYKQLNSLLSWSSATKWIAQKCLQIGLLFGSSYNLHYFVPKTASPVAQHKQQYKNNSILRQIFCDIEYVPWWYIFYARN